MIISKAALEKQTASTTCSYDRQETALTCKCLYFDRDCRQRKAGFSARQHRQSLRWIAAASKGAKTEPSPLVGVGEIADVEDVEGIRVTFGEANRPLIEYLVKWKESESHTWEPVENLSDNLLRDFEDKWWKTCRDGDEEAMRKILNKSPGVLPHCVDSNERSALHFSAAVGQAKCCEMLCKAGADVDQPDKDGYTPLHMAVGYSHVGAVKVLLDAGASPEIPDNQGRNVVQLVDSIRESMPYSPQLAGKRLALEEVAALLAGNLFEEVLPRKVLDSRALPNGSKEFLIQWLDGSDDSWVKDSDMSKEVLEDYAASLEYASAERLLKMKKRGDQRLYLVKWLDGGRSTWEFEDHLSPALIQAFESGNDKAFEQLAIPEQLRAEQPVSKRAARRARKQARRAALASDGASETASTQNGAHEAGVSRIGSTQRRKDEHGDGQQDLHRETGTSKFGEDSINEEKSEGGNGSQKNRVRETVSV